MKRMFFVLTAAVMLSAFAARGDVVAAVADKPPLVLTNVTLQIWGDAELREEIPPAGLLFLREDGEVYVGDGVTPGGNAVCVVRPQDLYSWTNDVSANGHALLWGSGWSQQADGGSLVVRLGTTSWLRLVSSSEGNHAHLLVSDLDHTNGTMRLTADTTDPSATLLVATNLLDPDAWQPATNATVVATTDASTTWLIHRLDTQAEFYRVLATVPREAGIHAERTLHATKGLDIDTTNGLTMGDTTWHALPDIGAIARAALRGGPLDALQDETFNGMESAGLSYVTNSAGVWVSGFGDLNTAIVPKYRKDGTEIAGILADAEGADSLAQVYIGADCIEVRDTLGDGSIISKSAFTALPDLMTVIWSGKNARFVGDIESHMFRVATSSDERNAGNGDEVLFKLGPFASCSNLGTFVSPYLKDVPAKCFISAASLRDCRIPAARTIGEMAFAYSGLETFEASRLQKIHTSAFKNCESLGRVMISSKVEIGNQAFMECGMLSNLTIDNALSIGARAFYGCTNLAGPSTCLLRYVKSVGEEAFMADKKDDPWLVPFSNVRRFELPRAKTVLSIPRDTVNLYIGKATKVPRRMALYTNLEHICVNSLKEIPDEWAVLRGAEWRGLPKLRGVTARNVKTVGNSAFYMCTNLGYISMSGVEKVGHSAFLGTACSDFRRFRNLRQIGNFAFAGSGIKQATGADFPKLEVVGNYAFIGCPRLSVVWLPAARHVGHNLCGSCGTSPTFRFGPSTNVTAIVLDSALDIGGSVGANCPNLEVFSAKSCIRMGGHMIDNTRCHTSDARQRAAERMEGLSFPTLQRCGSHAFAYATNATSFYAPSLTDVSIGNTWIEGAWTNIYVPALTYYDESMTLGSDNLETVTWNGTLPLGEVWSFDLEDGTTVEKTVGIVRDSGELLDRIRQLEWDTSEYYCMWTMGSTIPHPVSMTQTNWITTNWPARHVTVEVRGLSPTNGTAVIAIRKGWRPPHDCWLTIQSASSGNKRIQLGDVAFNEGELKHGQKVRYDIQWNSRMNMWIPTRTTFVNYLNSLDINGWVHTSYDCDEFPPIHDLPE